MQFSWNDPTAIMFAIYLLAMLAIGWLGYLGTKNLSDYILGGRSLGSFVTALSAGASECPQSYPSHKSQNFSTRKSKAATCAW